MVFQKEGHPCRLESLGGGTFVLNATLIVVENFRRIGLQQVENKKYRESQSRIKAKYKGSFQNVFVSLYFFGEQ